jgi:hypothetical protein
MICKDTNAGILKDIALAEYYAAGSLKRCIVKQENRIDLICGALIPQYLDDGKRKKLVKSLTFYENGSLESIVLQDFTWIQTKAGRIPAEMITFYESGAVKRIFPSFGSISAFWTEKDERQISPAFSLELPFGSFHGKAINVMFYESGDLRSLTLWPQDSMCVDTPAGKIWTRIGCRLYADGKIQSVEPLNPVPVNTPIGYIPAFDPDANGIDGDKNSLVFLENGTIKSVVSASAVIAVIEKDGKTGVHTPAISNSDYFDNAYKVVPLKVEFADNTVFIENKQGKIQAMYSISDCKFSIESFNREGFKNTCHECCE